MVAHCRLAQLRVHHRIQSVPDHDRLTSRYVMRPDTLHRRVDARHLGDDRVAIIRIQPSLVANLSAGLGIERRVVEYDLALLSGLQFADALSTLNDSQHFTAVRLRL